MQRSQDCGLPPSHFKPSALRAYRLKCKVVDNKSRIVQCRYMVSPLCQAISIKLIYIKIYDNCTYMYMYFIDYVLFLLKQLRLKLGKAKTAVEQAGKGLTSNNV